MSLRRKGDHKKALVMLALPLLLVLGLVLYQFVSFAQFSEFTILDKIITQQQQQAAALHQQQQQRQYNASDLALTTTLASAASATATTTSTSNPPLSANGFSFYYPSLREASYFAQEESYLSWNKVPYLHILETPLIQNQLNLTLLIESRLKLFETFCLPTIKGQTSQNFIWIVRVDTRLSTLRPEWIARLIGWLADDPRFFLIERDSNPPWRNGESTKQLVQSKVYTGERRRLEYYMAVYDQKHIFETRIDGDDGLHHAYMQYIADESIKILTQERRPPPAFFFWCVAQELEWHPVLLERRPGPFLEKNTTPMEPVPASPYTHGLWMPSPVYKDLCPTPGITRVYPLGTPTERVFRIGHHELWRKFKYRKASCQRPEDGPTSRWKELNCTPVVHLANTAFPALRSRTPTSASMVTVAGLNYGHLRTHYQMAHEYWNVSVHDFGLNPELIREMQTHVVDNLLEIAQEGLEGQCSFRHSCMVSFHERFPWCTWRFVNTF